MTAFVKGLAWFVALLSGLATLFALFGGQQWLEEKGWTLAPDTKVAEEITDDTTESEATESATDQETEGAQQEVDQDDETSSGTDSKSTDLGSIWASVNTWSENTFDNLFWGIAAVGFSMLIAGIAGALIAYGIMPVSDVAGFFQWLFAAVCVTAVVIMGILLHGVDPGYLGWFITLTVISAPLGFLIPIYADS